MGSGFFAGGVAQGIQSLPQNIQRGAQLGLQERGVALQEQQAQQQQVRAQRAAVDKAISDATQFTTEVITQAKEAGRTPDQIRRSIEPVVAQVERTISASGGDPSGVRPRVEALIAESGDITPEAATQRFAQTAGISREEARQQVETIRRRREGKPLPAETAGRLALFKVAIDRFPEIVEGVNQFGEIGTPENARALAEFEGRIGGPNRVRILIETAVEGIFRGLTGAAAPPTEFNRIVGNFTPSPIDTPETRRLKLNLLKDTVLNMADAIQSGRQQFIPLEEATARLDAAAARIGAETVPAAGSILRFDSQGNLIQ